MHQEKESARIHHRRALFGTTAPPRSNLRVVRRMIVRFKPTCRNGKGECTDPRGLLIERRQSFVKERVSIKK